MAKRNALLFIILTVIFVNLFSVKVYPTENADRYFTKNFEDMSVEELDITWSKETDAYGIIPVYDENGDMYAIKTWVTDKRPILINHKLNNEVDDGMLYVSFDYKTTERFNDSFLRLKSGDTQFQICGFRNTGKFGHFLEFSKWALDKNTSVDYSPETWYKVGILFDMEIRKAYLYFGESGKNANLIETVDIPENFGKITDVVMAHSFGNYTPAMWDNFTVCDMTTDIIDEIQEKDNLVFEDEIYEKYTEVMLDEDFQTEKFPNLGFSNWSDDDAIYGVGRENIGVNEYALKSWVGVKNPVVLDYPLKSPMNRGVYFVSYDWMSEGGYNDSYLRLQSGETRYQVCGFRNTGTFGKFIDFSKWALNKDTEVSYSADVWYTVSVVMDFDFRNVYIWFGEKGGTLSLIEKSPMVEGFTDFNNIIFVHSYGAYPSVLWDNMKICRLNSETVQFTEKETGITFEENIKSSVAITLETEEKGNIFSNAESVEVFVDYDNRSLVQSDYDVWYEMTYGDEILMSEGKIVSVAPNGELVETVILPTGNKYGFFTFKVYNGDKSKVLAETRFSNVHTAKDGVRNDKAGTTLHLTRVEDKQGAVEILEKGGFSIVRGGQNDWKDVETSKGVYKTESQNESYYALMTENGFENMTILKGSNELYANEYPTSNPERVGLVENPPQSDGVIEKFAKYCYETVILYPEVKYFQVWNEWNNAPTFNLDNVTGASNYAKLLKAAYKAVKEAEKERGREAVVVAMAPSGTKATWISEALAALGDEKCFDIISVHPYTYTDGGANKESTYAPEDVCVRHKTERGNVVTRINAVKQVLEENGYTDIPVWAGEFGFSSYECGEEKQAQYATRMMALCDGNDVLDRMLWYTFQNHTSSTEKEQNFGMIRHHTNVLVPYEAKPVYVALSNYNALMAKAEIEDRILDGESGAYLYKFKGRDGNHISAAWTTGEPLEYEFVTQAKVVEVYDIYGNKEIILVENGMVTVSLTENISYIKELSEYAAIVQNGKLISRISELTPLNEFKILTDSDSEFDIILAKYKSGDLIDAVSYNSKEDKSFQADSETDEIRVFFWDNMNPVLDKLVIN